MNRKLTQLHEQELWMAEQKKAHPEEEILERYAMNRLEEPALGEFEEHLLLCGHCQERLDEVTEYLSVIWEATSNVAAAPPTEAAWRRWLRLEWLPVPAPALVGAMVLLVGILFWQPWRDSAPTEWRTVELATLRGETAAAKGMEGFALQLRLDVTGLDAAGATGQIVTAGGSLVTEGPLVLVDGKAELRYAAGLSAGQYWIRLKKTGETVREYSLVVARR